MNHFRELWDLGYHRLVPVVPPDADLSPKSSLATRLRAGVDSRGKAPGVVGRDGLWKGLQFVAMESREEDLDDWSSWGASVGVKTGGGLIALDIDTTNSDAAQELYKIAYRTLGPAAVRFGKKPKCLMLYRAPESVTYKQLRFSTPTEDDARVEVLAEGRQFVARGTHPGTGRPYAWPQGIPHIDTLASVSEEQIEAFFAEACAALPGAKVHDSAADRDAPDQETLRAPSWDALRETVDAIPNTSALFPERNDYVAVAYAIKAAAPDGYEIEAQELYLDWCDRWQDGHNDPDVALADWNRAKPPYRVGFSFLERNAVGMFFAPSQPDALDDLFAANAEATGDVPQKRRPVIILSDEDIQNRPDPVWLIDNFLPEAGFNILYGDPGTGKSFIALDMALHLATDRPDWHGEKVNNHTRGAVLYIAGEGEGDFKLRLQAWKQKNLPTDTFIPKDRFGVIFAPMDFRSAEDLKTLKEAVEASGFTNLSALVIDTLARATPGADENAALDMGLFVRACDMLRDLTGATVLAIHHANKGGNLRGSTALIGAADSIFRFDRQHGHSTGTLSCQKMKAGSDSLEVSFSLDKTILSETTDSLVPRRLTEEEAKKSVCTDDMKQRILDAAQEAWDLGEPWSFSPRATGRYGPKIVARMLDVHADVAEAWLRGWTHEPDKCLEMAVRDPKRRREGLRVVRAAAEDLGEEDAIFG